MSGAVLWLAELKLQKCRFYLKKKKQQKTVVLHMWIFSTSLLKNNWIKIKMSKFLKLKLHLNLCWFSFNESNVIQSCCRCSEGLMQKQNLFYAPESVKNNIKDSFVVKYAFYFEGCMLPLSFRCQPGRMSLGQGLCQSVLTQPGSMFHPVICLE